MGRHDKGFYGVQRRLLTEMVGDPTGYLIWTFLIGRANWVDSAPEKIWGERRIIKRGQCLTSIDEIADQWNLHERTVRHRLKGFEADGRITQEARTGHGRIITIVNYERYQSAKGNLFTDNRDDAGYVVNETYGNNEPNNSNGAAPAGSRPEALPRVAGGVAAGCRSVAGSSAGFGDKATNDNHEPNNSNGAAPAGFCAADVAEPLPSGCRGIAEPRPHNQPGNKGNKNKGTRSLFTDDADAPSEHKARPTKSENAAEGKASKSGPTWEAYSTAIRLFHNFDPKPNAQVRSQACKLVDLLGADVAPEVAEYYVLNEKRHWVVQARHPFGELLKNAQKYFGDWTTGQKVSTAAARTIERDDANRDAIRQYRANQKSSANLGG